MSDYFDYIDTSFDESIEKDGNFPWLPWIGKKFALSNTKTLILGESTYNWSNREEDREKVKIRISKNDHLRIVHKNNAIDFKGKSPYARNIERAIFFKKRPSRAEAKTLWSNVVYHNLILRAMPTKKHRPIYNDYINGWQAFINLVKIIPIDQCLVYGVDFEKVKSLKLVLDDKEITYTYKKINVSVGKSFPRRIHLTIDDREIKLLFVRHPSAFFKWREWGSIINNELVTKSITENY